MNIVTIKDVAARAGVSTATASRVLSGSPSTSAESRRRVDEAARALDFRPNLQARALRSTRSDTIGLLLSDVRNPFFADLAHTVEQAAQQAGYVTLLGNANERADQQNRYLETLMDRRVDGVIVAPQGDDTGTVEQLVAREIPTVFVDRVIPGVDVPSVTTDSTPGIRQTVAHLAALGHTRIGYIAGPQTVSTGRERFTAYRDAIDEAGLSDDPDLVVFGDFQAASGSLGVTTLLGLREPPTAIFAADSLMAVGAIAITNRLGLRVGRDLALVAFDDIEWFSLLEPALSVVAHSIEDMGRVAVELLLEVIAGNHPESVRLPSELVVRASSATPITRPSQQASPSQQTSPTATPQTGADADADAGRN